MTTTRPVTTRPAEFDARVMEYLPGLRRLAMKLAPPQYREDLVSDTVLSALENWQSFREDGGMWGWLKWRMRNVVSAQAYHATRLKRHGRRVSLESASHLAEPPRQVAAAELSIALESLARVNNGDLILRAAQGETFGEIAAERGVSRQRIHQVAARARKEWQEAMA